MIAHTQTICVGDPRGIPGDCLRTAVASLLDLPIEAVPHFLLFEGAWFDAVKLWCRHNGYILATPEEQPNGPCLAFGQSPRDVYHAVVWADGACLHDPHPSRAGLIAPDAFWTIDRDAA